MTEVVLGSYWHAVLQSSGSEHATSAYIDALRKRAVRLYWSSFVLNTVLLWTAAGSLTAGISVGVSIGQLLAGSAIPLFLAFCLTPPLAGTAIPTFAGTAAHDRVAGEGLCNSRHAGEA